jgi:ABC-type uncharacterized transport system involved in gliding motility auxiliary subunit
MDKRLSSFLSTLFSVLMGLAIWALALAISNSNKHPMDITRGGRFTLAPQSKQAVTNLPSAVKVYAFVDDRGKGKAEEVLQRYANVDKSKFTFEVLEARKNPAKAKKYEIRFAGEGVVELQDEANKGRTERLSSISEQDITTALLKLQRKKNFKAYFVTGHGERDFNASDAGGLSQLKSDLVKEGFTVEALSLTATPKVPADADLLVCAGPIRPLLPGEEKVLQEYLANYGRMLMCWEPETPASWSKLIGDYGVQVTDEIALDQASQMLNAEPVYSIGLVYDPAHPVTRDYKMQTMFELARPVKLATPPPSGVTGTTLVTTNSKPPTALLVGLQEVLGSKGSLRLDPSKVKPSVVTLAVSVAKKEAEASPSPTPTPGAEQPKETRETRLITVGDTDFMTNGNSMYVINKDLVLNSFSWLAANETQISIRPKDPEATPLTLTSSDQSRLMFLLAFILPGSLILLGSFMVMRRQ